MLAGGCDDDSAVEVHEKALIRRHPMRVHINLAKAGVVLVVLFLSGVLVHLGTSQLLARGPRDNTAAFVFLVGPNTEKDNRTRGLGIALHTLYHHYQVRTAPLPSLAASVEPHSRHAALLSPADPAETQMQLKLVMCSPCLSMRPGSI